MTLVLPDKPKTASSQAPGAVSPISPDALPKYLSKLFLQQSDIIMIQLDEALLCHRVSANLQRCLDMPVGNLMGQGFRRLLCNKTRDAMVAYFRKIRLSPQSEPRFNALIRLQYGPEKEHAFALEAAVLTPSGIYACLLRDVSKETHLEASCRRLKRETRQATQSRKDFLAYVNHELRTPLNAIIGFSQMMESGLYGTISNPRYREYIRGIRQSGTSLLQTVNMLLDMATIEQSQDTRGDQQFSLQDILEVVYNQHSALAFQQNVRVKFSDNHNHIWIFGNQARLLHALSQLYCLAILHSPANSLVTLEITTQARGMLRISITDSGEPRQKAQVQDIMQTSMDAVMLQPDKPSEPAASYIFAREVASQHQGRFTLIPGEETGNAAIIILPESRVQCSGNQGAVQE